MRALGELILSDIKKNTYIDFISEYLGKVLEQQQDIYIGSVG